MFLQLPQIALIIVAAVLFFRRSSLAAGIGLATFCAIALLNQSQVQGILPDLGLVNYLISGLILAGTLIWLLSWNRLVPETSTFFRPKHLPKQAPQQEQKLALAYPILYEKIMDQLSADDLLDVIYDLEFNEGEIIFPNKELSQITLKLIETASLRGKIGALNNAIDRILHPVPKENLPRLEKLSTDTPPQLLRQYFTAQYSLAELEEISKKLDLDWEEFGTDGKKSRVRRLLLYVRRRNRLGELIRIIQAP